MTHTLEVFNLQGESLFASNSRWLLPLFELEVFMNENALSPAQIILFDKVVGRAGALLIARLNIKTVKTQLLSERAVEIFNLYGVSVTAESRIERIGCSSEDFLANETNLDVAYTELKSRADRSKAKSEAVSLEGLVDCHFHLSQAERHNFDMRASVQESFNQGMTYALEAGPSEHDFEKRKALALAIPGVYLSAGYHPDAADKPHIVDFDAMRAQASFEKTVALGEMGLDYSYKIPRDKQTALLATQLDMALELKKPVILHVRDAQPEALALVAARPGLRGVVHCYTGDVETAKRWLNLGFYLSFSGIITFKNSQIIRESARYAPSDRLFCETDAPYLAPVPHRGEVNRPAYVAYVYKEVAALKGITDWSTMAHRLQSNFRELFGVS